LTPTANDDSALSLYPLYTLSGHAGFVKYLIEFANDLLATACDSSSIDSTIRVWDLRNGNVKYILFGHSTFINSLASLGDDLLISASKEILIWSMKTGARHRNLSQVVPSYESVLSLDSSSVFASNSGGAIRARQADTGSII
jgi:WD40 repeat protein